MQHGGYKNELEFAQECDNNDPLKSYRERFYFPLHEGKPCLYYTGNSLGLQPKTVAENIRQELDDWAKYGVEGHFDAKNPWYSYHEILTEQTARLVGAQTEEVVVMNSLTTNLHLLMVSFYRPTASRYKILCEGRPFPSDSYALESQVKFHGYDPQDAIVELHPREGEHTIRPEDWATIIEEHKNELAAVLVGGVNFYTGQVFDMKEITRLGHEAGAMVGFDLAHAAGNVELKLHDWDVDFACWCSYKYLNSGPGGVSGVFINHRHVTNPDLIRFAGWWGHDKETRFKMEKGFIPMPTAESWQLSNAPVLSMAAHKASLDIFDEVGMDALRKKSQNLTAYLDFVIADVASRFPDVEFEIITPSGEGERGCQLSILAHGAGKSLFDFLTSKGVIADWREPNVIRVAPVPLYNSYEDVYRFGQVLEEALRS